MIPIRHIYPKLNSLTRNTFYKGFKQYSTVKSAPTVTVLPGDGVWPDLFEHLRHVFNTTGVPVNFENKALSELPGVRSDSIEDVLDSFQRNKVGLKGIIATPISGPDPQTINMQFRKKLDLFANVMRIRSFEGFPTRYRDLDFVVIREQTEGEYSALEHESVPGVVESLKIITREKSKRIAKFAFDYAKKHNRKRVTAVHKANIMKLSDGLFLQSCQEVSSLYPDIKFDGMIVDNCCMQLVSRPYQFDVMVMPNLYGAVIGNVATGLIGGAGMVPGESYSNEVAVFEPGSRHPFSVAVGRNIANPIALFLSAAEMLRYLNLHSDADKLEQSVLNVIKDGKVRTQDMGGMSTTTEMVDEILSKI